MPTHEIVFSPRAQEHVDALSRPRRAALFDAVARQLQHQPAVETRNRKPMKADRPGYIAPWELRVADLRVYYDVEDGPPPKVVIVAVGVKVRDRVRIGDREFEP